MAPRRRKLPLDHGLRAAARALGVSHGWLSIKAQLDSSQFGPDRERMSGSDRVPMWSEDRIKEVKRALRKSRSK